MRRSFVAVISMVLIVGACGGDDTDPGSTIEAYTAAYNEGDIDGVMVFFSEESVITGHPANDSVVGLTQIRAVHLEDLSFAAEENAYTISHVEVTGDTVTWDHVWVSDEGEKYCQVGHSAVIKDDIILTWTWPNSEVCP